MSRRLYKSIAGFVLLAGASASMPQRGELNLTIEAPPSLALAAGRVRNIDRQQLAAALERAGLDVPPRVHVTLLPEDDSRARATPRWIVGRAFGSHDVAIFPDCVGAYPYGSPEDTGLRCRIEAAPPRPGLIPYARAHRSRAVRSSVSWCSKHHRRFAAPCNLLPFSLLVGSRLS